MLRVIGCLTEDHEWRLVVLAALICLAGSFTALSLLARARSTTDRPRFLWLAVTGLVAGCGVWATHFVAMLAFRPNLPLGFDAMLTVLSILIAVVVMGAGFAVALMSNAERRAVSVAGGCLAGLGIFVMHYTGMAAMRVPAEVDYDPAYVLASLVIGAGFGGLALAVALSGNSMSRRFTAAALLTLAIAGLHFTGMAALSLVPSPLIPVPAQAISPEWLAVGVAITTLVILGSGLAGSIVDQRFADRSQREAARLRATIGELEMTQVRLEASTAQLVTALEAAAAGSQAKSVFLASMSHELRTPLNAVIGFSEALAADLCGPLNPKQREYVVEIGTAGAQLLTLINDVLDLTKVDTDGLVLDEQEIDLAGLLGDTAAAVGTRARRGGVSLNLTLAHDLPLLRADPRRLRQVIQNLLSNAIKFTPAGGKVSLTTRLVPLGVEIQVIDTGIGMAPEDVAKALERFGQVDSQLDRRYDGTGLGLPLAKRLVEIHGGSLVIDSASGRGTTVTVTLPSHRLIDAALVA